MSADRVDVVVVGAGVVGLAIARALARRGREVIVLEREELIGSHTSSRNSGVIHAGIYYPEGSLKARLCVAGKHALYAFCEDYGVEHRRVGKILVATHDSQLPLLDDFQERARCNGVNDLCRLSAAEVVELEPDVICNAGLLSPSTGIIDAHDYMLALHGDIERHGGHIALASSILGARIDDDGFVVFAGGAGEYELRSAVLINAAGLSAQTVASLIQGLAPEHVPPTYFAKGNYFFLAGSNPFRHLVYPMPTRGSLGVHVSFDTGGRCRFGPDIHWVSEPSYAVESTRLPDFYAAIRRYWPNLPNDALHPDYTGVRPKLTAEGEPAADFVIQGPGVHGIDGLVNLFGIESPGLTSSLAIGDYVADMLK